jgi:hypothetical protein
MAARPVLGARTFIAVAALGIVVAACGPGKPAGATATKANAMAAEETVGSDVIANGGRLTLGDGPTRAVLAPAGGKSLADRLVKVSTGRQIVLVFRALSAQSPPGTTYRVYLGLPEGAPADDAHYVAKINFYGAVELAGAARKPNESVAFDVTALAGRWAAGSNAQLPLTVTLIPENEVESNSQPVVGSVELIEK